jgi:hypothetical protein
MSAWAAQEAVFLGIPASARMLDAQACQRIEAASRKAVAILAAE